MTNSVFFFLQIVRIYICCLRFYEQTHHLGFLYSKLRAKQPNKILLNLCAALLGLYVVFIVMISVDTERYEAELDLVSCSILAAALHYFTLASLAWMGIEGVNMYLLFIKVVDNYIQRFMLKACLFAWGKSDCIFEIVYKFITPFMYPTITRQN